MTANLKHCWYRLTDKSRKVIRRVVYAYAGYYARKEVADESQFADLYPGVFGGEMRRRQIVIPLSHEHFHKRVLGDCAA